MTTQILVITIMTSHLPESLYMCVIRVSLPVADHILPVFHCVARHIVCAKCCATAVTYYESTKANLIDSYGPFSGASIPFELASDKLREPRRVIYTSHYSGE